MLKGYFNINCVVLETKPIVQNDSLELSDQERSLLNLKPQKRQIIKDSLVTGLAKMQIWPIKQCESFRFISAIPRSQKEAYLLLVST